MLAAGNSDNDAMIWDVTRGTQIGKFCTGKTGKGMVVSFSDQDRNLAGYSFDNNIYLWSIADGKPAGKQFYKPTYPANSVAFSKDTLALPGDDGIILWDTASPGALSGEQVDIGSLAFSSDNKLASGGTIISSISLWDADSRQHLGKLQQPRYGESGEDSFAFGQSAVNSLAFDPDGKILASGLLNGTIILWDASTRQPSGELPADPEQTTEVSDVVFSADGRTLASAVNPFSSDTEAKAAKRGEIIMWDVNNRSRIGAPFTGHEGPITGIAFSRDGKLLASGSKDKAIILWDAVAHKQIRKLTTHELLGEGREVESVAFSPHDEILAVGLDNGKIILLNAATLERIGTPLEGLSGQVTNLAFSHDGKMLASVINKKANDPAGTTGIIMLWNVEKNGKHEQLGDLFIGHENAISSIAFSTNNKWLASGGRDGRIILWEVDVVSAPQRFKEIVNRNLDDKKEEEEKEKYVGEASIFQRLFSNAKRFGILSDRFPSGGRPR